MFKAKVERVSLIISVLLLSACSHTQPQVSTLILKKKERVTISIPPTSIVTPIATPIATVPTFKVEEPKQQINVTELSLNSRQVLQQEENWVPLKVEDEIEWNAKELLGHKYVWGATGPYNYDCSGFTRKVFGDVGIHLPRVSREQSKKGELVSFYELKKGDLVFFATKKRHPNRVTHVGIYLGGGDFIHASSGAKKIVVFNFNEHQYYKKHFLWGRRVIQDNRYMASAY